MSRALKKHSQLKLNNSQGVTCFEIIDVIGTGGSCVAYQVSYNENGDIPHKGILKEYCPAFLETENFSREGGAIVVPQSLRKEFEYGFEDFTNGYKYINEYLAENLSASNYHPVQLGLYEGNNTVYTLSSCDYGQSYDKIQDDSLLEIIKLMLSVTKAVEMYHSAGYLHLDIKPKNILVLADVTDLIKLFDFDSLTSIEQLKSKKVNTIPVPEDYYVPELAGFDRRNIGIQTDIYEIGAMAYARIFKRNPTAYDADSIDKIDVEMSDFTLGISPQAKYELAQLFKNTLQISRRKRYKTTAELKAQLEKIISLLSDKEPYPLDMPRWQPTANYVGRKNEMHEIKQRLDKDGYVFVRGIGGLGKSEIVKMFAKSFADEYHTVQFCKFSGSLRAVLASMPFYAINDDDYNDFNELLSVKNKVLHLCDEHTLIVVDNFNVTYDDFLRDFLPANNRSFKVIFTSRCKPASDYYKDKVYELPKLSMLDCKTIFRLHSQTQEIEKDDEQTEQIIEKTDYNTLIIILMALAIKKTGISTAQMLEKLESQKLESIEQKIFHEYDVSSEEAEYYDAMYAHLNAIFSVSTLTNSQKEILKNATLISPDGLSVSDFILACNKDTVNKESVYELSGWGWLNIDESEIITMHPIVSDLIFANDSIKKEDSYYHLAEELEEYCNPDYLSHISVVMDRLSCALQLERRYQNENAFERCMIAAKVGRMYQNAFFPSEAKKYLLKALKIAETEETGSKMPSSYKLKWSLKERIILKGAYITKSSNKMLLPYICFFLGGFEKEFGTKTASIDYYKRSIEEGKKVGFVEIMLASKKEIAECYVENNNLNQAYKEYVAAFKFGRLFHLKGYLGSIAHDLSEVCALLELSSEERKYKKYAQKYSAYYEDETFEGYDEYNEAINSGDYEYALKQYEMFIAKQRDILGESSPVYKSISAGLWVYYAINKQKQQALKLLNESITFISSTHGKNSMALADCLSVAAETMPILGELDYAFDFANRAIDICKKNSECDSYTYLRAKMALISIAIITVNLREAERLINEIDFNAFSGNDFLEDIVQSAGLALSMLSKFDKLEPMCLDLLSKKNASDLAKFQANILMSISKEYQGNLDEAERYAKESTRYADFVKTAYIKDEWMIQYYRCMARIDFRKGKYESAIKKLDELIAHFGQERKDDFLLYSSYLERGLCHAANYNQNAAMQDFKQCEKILKNNHCPEEMYFLLYNNMVVGYMCTNKCEEALDCIHKIAKINSNIYNPTSYYEAIACGNLGLILYNMGNKTDSEKYFYLAVKCMEKLKIDNTHDYFTIKCDLAKVYAQQERYDKALEIYLDIRKKHSPDSDASGEYERNTCEGILEVYLATDRAQQAYDFACKEVEELEHWFGKYSINRIAEIIKIGGIIRENGYTDSYDFFLLAEKLLKESGQTETFYYAVVLNYIGACETDWKKKHVLAYQYFEKSKDLFEKLNKTDGAFYKTVLNNIEYVKNLIMNTNGTDSEE